MLLLTTSVIYEECRSDWSHQFSAVQQLDGCSMTRPFSLRRCGLRDYIYASWCAITLLVIPDSLAVTAL